VIHGTNAISPLQSPPNRQTWRMWLDMCMIVALVPLQRLCLLSRLHNSITGHSAFSSRLATGNLEALRELRNLIGNMFG